MSQAHCAQSRVARISMGCARKHVCMLPTVDSIHRPCCCLQAKFVLNTYGDAMTGIAQLSPDPVSKGLATLAGLACKFIGNVSWVSSSRCLVCLCLDSLLT